MRALILSAGLGERLRPLTLKRAKPAVEFLNIPMLAYPYHWLSALGLTEVAFNTHYLPETVRHAAMQVVRPEHQLHFPYEEHILGSGGGIWNARFHLMPDEYFADANGDAVVTFADPSTLSRMRDEHLRSGALATLLLCPLEGVGTRIPGVWVDHEMTVMGFGKDSPSPTATCLHYASFMFFSKRIWDLLPPESSNIFYDVLVNAIAQGERVRGFRVDDMRWFETGNYAEYLAATATCLESLRVGDAHGKALMSLLSGDHMPRFERRSSWPDRLLVADSAEIAPDVEFEGPCVVGPDARIEAGARILSSVILPGAHVLEGETIQSTIRA